LYSYGFLKHKVAVNLKIGAHNILQNNYNISYATKGIESIHQRQYARRPEMTLFNDSKTALEISLAESLFSRDSLAEDMYTVTGTIPSLPTSHTVNNEHWCVT